MMLYNRVRPMPEVAASNASAARFTATTKNITEGTGFPTFRTTIEMQPLTWLTRSVKAKRVGDDLHFSVKQCFSSSDDLGVELR